MAMNNIMFQKATATLLGRTSFEEGHSMKVLYRPTLQTHRMKPYSDRNRLMSRLTFALLGKQGLRCLSGRCNHEYFNGRTCISTHLRSLSTPFIADVQDYLLSKGTDPRKVFEDRFRVAPEERWSPRYRRIF